MKVALNGLRADGHQEGGWVLTLTLATSGQLLALLGDGKWRADLHQAPWPPTGGPALPPATRAHLTELGPILLRLQLVSALDDWPWEEEIVAARPDGGVVPRYVLDLGAPTGTTEVLPLVVVARGSPTRALLQAARDRERPLVVVDPAAADLARRLDVLVRRHWRDPLPLSMTLAAALADCPLPLAQCRLYGDGRTGIAEREQGRRPVTAVSIDVVRSTPLLQAGDEAYAQRLQAYYELCRDVIERLQGYVDPPQGNDGLMAYFGFPLAVEDSASRALDAAWQLTRRMADLRLSVRIGVASGNVAVSARQAFGSHVHLAARLREAAEPGQVLVAHSTCERAGVGHELVEYVLAKPLKDYPEQTKVWRLAGVAEHGVPLRPAAAAGPFVGRARELAMLRAAWQRASAGRLEWCCVTGEPGIGKSRLLQEFARELHAEGWPCLEFTGHPQWVSSPFAAVIDSLRRREGLDAAMDVEQLTAWLAANRLPPLPPAPAAAESDAGGGQRSWRDLLLDWLAAQAARGPLCILIDDAHWLDPSSIDLLHRLAQRSTERPLLVLVGDRGDSARTLDLAGSPPIDLQGLSADDAAALAVALGAELPDSIRRRIVERAEGVPLFLEEESLRLLGRAEQDPPGTVPATLEDLLMVRLDALGPDRTLAQLIAVFGRECTEPELRALMALDDPFVVQARQQGSIGSLLGSGLIQQVGGAPPVLRFKHALFRDAAYTSIWGNDRRRLHGLCADLIQRDLPELVRQRPEQLAQHLDAAGRFAAARRAWQAAARLAAARQAHAETLQLARRALALDADTADAESTRATMQMHLLAASAQIALQGYGSPEVEAEYQAAELAGQRLPGREHALRIRLGLEACYVMRGDLARASDLARAAVAETAWDHDTRLAMQARWALANVRFHQGDWVAALAGFDECLQHYRPELHRPSSVQDPAVMCLGYSSWIQFEIGQADEALARIGRMLELVAELQHPFSSAVAHSFAASLKRLCGDSAAAWPHALEAQRICDEGDFPVWRAHAWMVRGQLRADRGDATGGDEDMRRGYERWTGSGARISAATYRITRAEILLRQRRTAEAVAELEAAWTLSESIGERYYHAELLRLQALAAWQAGDKASASARLERAGALAQSTGRAGLALRCALSAGALAAADGRFRPAIDHLRAVTTTLARHGRARDLRWARLALDAWDRGRAFAANDATPWEPT